MANLLCATLCNVSGVHMCMYLCVCCVCVVCVCVMCIICVLFV